MPTATSTAPPPSSSQENNARQSNAIQKGTDLLLELFNEEKSRLTLLYHENLQKHLNQYKDHADAQIASNYSQLTKLSTRYVKSMQDLVTTRNGLQQARAEYAKLMASVEEVGLVYINGTLHFNDHTAKIVSNFREGARMQDMVISHMNQNLDRTAPDENTEAFSEVIEPSEFFAFLSGVLAKSQRYAHSLQLQHECEGASPSKGDMSENDAVPQDSGFAPNSLIKRPGVDSQNSSLKRPTSSSALPSPSNKLHKSS